MARLGAIFAVALLPVVLLFAGASAQEHRGRVTGTVFHDLNGDAVLDPGERGISERLVTIAGPGGFFADQFTGSNGTYEFGSLAPATYRLAIEPDQPFSRCFGPPTDVYSFAPLFSLEDSCVDGVHSYRVTTPQRFDAAAVDAGGTVVVNFGLQPRDVVTMVGHAILEDGYASPGTPIKALYEGTECGVAHVTADSYNVQMDVFGAGERPGCPEEGGLVSFTVGGVPVDGQVAWVPFSTLLEGGRDFASIDLVAMEQHAWYFAQPVVDDPPSDGTIVQAKIGDTLCGEATTVAYPIGQGTNAYLVGFSKLIVPSAGLKAGCGTLGSIVSFWVGGALVDSVAWEPGLHEIGFDIEGALESHLPTAGTGDRVNGSASLPWFGLAAVLGFVVLAAGFGLRLRLLR